MKKATLNTKGFGLVGVLAVVLIVAVIGFSGWLVWHKNHDSNKNHSTSSTKGNTNNTATDETASWATVTTQDNAFSMKVPDGWKMVRYPGSYIGSSDVAYQKDTPATITSSNTAYAGDGLLFHASISEVDSTNLSPQWQSPQSGLTESSEDFSIGSLQGKRFKAIFTGTTEQTLYEYEFNVGQGKRLSILYTIYPREGGIDDVATVEKAIKTIQIN